LIDDPDQIELFGYPSHCSDVSDSASANRAGLAEIGDWRGVGRPQDGLPGEGALADSVPQGLGGDAVAAAPDRTLEYVHSFV
jgi:hypothetical protein